MMSEEESVKLARLIKELTDRVARLEAEVRQLKNEVTRLRQ